MPNLPSGTVTFLFSDIEGSTTLLKSLGDARYAELLATHRSLMRETFAGYGGQEIDTQGDAFFYSFPRARDAVAAAVTVQQAHAKGRWPDDVAVRLRIGLHTGEPAVGDEGYTGLDVVRASRIAAVGIGGQTLLSDTTRAIVAGDLGDGVTLNSLGERKLKDIDRPEPLYELLIDGINPEPAAASDPNTETIGDSFREFSTRAGQTIESRVLARLESALGGDFPFLPAAGAAPPPKRGMTSEIARLHRLREDGALTAEQYERAVDRLLDQPEVE
jgi:class 3 adenylate cyclase